jgi:formylglycine-generating enzyme required for sulfatase activity
VEQFARFAGERFTEEKCLHYDKKSFFKKTWLKPPFDQTSQHPVICITANNAQAYAEWLSEQTGVNYRLPTQQEFTYLNNQLQLNNSCQSANLAGSEASEENKATDNTLSCSDGQIFTAPVATFSTNLKVADLNGNVSEWVTNCSNQTVCAIGNSWRSGFNSNNTQPLAEAVNQTYSHIGFRLVREL